MIRDILLAFIPLFVAVDAIGVLPMFISLTKDIERKERIKIIIQSMIRSGRKSKKVISFLIQNQIFDNYSRL